MVDGDFLHQHFAGDFNSKFRDLLIMLAHLVFKKSIQFCRSGGERGGCLGEIICLPGQFG